MERKRDFTIELLVAAVEKDLINLPETMNLETDAVLVNQSSHNGYLEIQRRHNCKIRCYEMTERGVGISRNCAITHVNPQADVCLFADEDIVYESGYAARIEEQYRLHPDADVILFNIEVNENRRTYWNDCWKRIRWFNYGRYPAYSISMRVPALQSSNVHYSVLFGGGAKYSNGEDSLFLHDCLKSGLKVYASPVCLGREEERPSTWFKGYTDKFFFDRGVLYAYLYGPMAAVWGLRFLYKNRNTMLQEKSLKDAYKLLKKGILEGKKRSC